MGYIVLQLIMFVPFYLMWRKDCKTIGKDKLAVSLGERFLTWLAFCPIWAIPIIKWTSQPAGEYATRKNFRREENEKRKM